MGKFVANAPQGIPVLGGGQPAELFEAVEAVAHGQGPNVFLERAQDGRHQALPQVVLQAGISISELIEQTPVDLGQGLQVRRPEGALFQIVERFPQGVAVDEADLQILPQGEQFRGIVHKGIPV